MIHRNSLLTGIFIIALGLAGFYILLVSQILGVGLIGQSGEYLWDQHFWLIYGPKGSIDLLFHLVSSGILLLMGITGGFFIRRQFQRNASMELFFYSFFFFLIAFDVLRLLGPLFSFWNQSYMVTMVLSRVVYGLRLLEMFSLLAVSIYALGFEYQKSNHILFGAAVISLGLMLYWPMDTHGISSTLLVRMAEEPAMVFVMMLLMVLTLLSLVIATRMTGRVELKYQIILATLVILGRTGTYFPTTFWYGILLLVIGTVGFLRIIKDDSLSL